VRRAYPIDAGFVPRFCCKKKRYEYSILMDRVRDPAQMRFAWRVDQPLDLERMRHASLAALGTHDFAAFRSARDERTNTVRSIEHISIEPEADGRGLKIAVEGPGFMYNMVRILVGTLVDIGRGRLPATRVAEALDREGLVLRVFDAFRPIRATEAMYTWAAARGRRHLFADGWIARRSMHNRGVAVDVTLVDARTGEAVPMGTAFDAFDPGSSYPNAAGAAAAHRRQLRAAMTTAGFASTDLEWWHFELGRGDEARRDAPYGAAEAPSALG
jgi:hypothetical protein